MDRKYPSRVVEQERELGASVDKRLEAELAKMGTIGDVADQIAEDRARQRELEQDAAERLLGTYIALRRGMQIA